MPSVITTTVNTARLVQLIAVMGSRSRAAVDETAGEIQQRASQMAPRDTGSLAASIYVNNGETSDYAQRSGAARAANDDAVILGEIRPEEVISLFGENANAYTAVVGVAVGHGGFQELGTRFQSAQPFLFPAVEGLREDFIGQMSNITAGF